MAAQLDRGAGGDQRPTDKQTNTVAGIKWRQLSEIVADRWAAELLMKCVVILVLLVEQHKDKVALWFPRRLVYSSCQFHMYFLIGHFLTLCFNMRNAVH